MKTFLAATASIIISTMALAGAAHAENQAFANPKVSGDRLDLCLNWGSGCGQPAAEKFCQSHGWSKATSYAVAHDFGAYAPTRLIGTSAVCDQDFCDGFKQIACSN